MAYDRNISRTKTYSCIQCGTIKPWRFNGKNLYCSRRCLGITQEGKIVSEETKKLMSENSKGKHKNPRTEFKKGQRPSIATEYKKGQVAPNKGKTIWVGEKRKNLFLHPFPKGELHPGWKGGITSVNKQIRESIEYEDWRKSVFERDAYTCQHCGQIGGFLHADHIKPFAFFPKLRFDLTNGRTLCISCHRKTDTYGRRAYKYKESNI